MFLRGEFAFALCCCQETAAKKTRKRGGRIGLGARGTPVLACRRWVLEARRRGVNQHGKMRGFVTRSSTRSLRQGGRQGVYDKEFDEEFRT